ncbi:MAG: DNRLRE domain-containing protein [bacterium]
MKEESPGFMFISICFATCIFTIQLFAQSSDSTLVATIDNTIYSEADSSNGAGDHLFAGSNRRGAIRRGLVAFDLTQAILPGATIESVTLTLNMSRTTSAARDVALHRLLVGWGEGASDAIGEEGSGATATTGDATWRHRIFDTDLWANPGGDFSPSASAMQTVAGIGSYTWQSTAQMVADVQLWVDKPDSNFGWILLGNESQSRTTKRFDSHNNSDESVRPLLTVTFSPVTSVDNHNNSLPTEFGLAQNYPNPFNSGTVIHYTTPQSSHSAEVRLQVFNILGQKVRTLVNAKQPAGSHSARWDGANDAGQLLPTGVYVYHLQAGRFVDIKKMVLVR